MHKQQMCISPPGPLPSTGYRAVGDCTVVTGAKTAFTGCSTRQRNCAGHGCVEGQLCRSGRRAHKGKGHEDAGALSCVFVKTILLH